MMQTAEKHIHCLLVEDNSAHADLIKICMEDDHADNHVDHVSDGMEALAYLRQDGKYADAARPDMIILDLKLPGMDGHEVLAAIRRDESLASIPVIILTTSTAEGDRARAYELQANSYLTKPAEFGEMREMVRDLNRYWARWNQPPGDRHSERTRPRSVVLGALPGADQSMFVNTVCIARETLDEILDQMDADRDSVSISSGRGESRSTCRIYDLPMTIHHRDAHSANHLVVARNISHGGLAFLHRGAVRVGSEVSARLPRLQHPCAGRTVYCEPFHGVLNQIGVVFDAPLTDEELVLVRSASEGNAAS